MELQVDANFCAATVIPLPPGGVRQYHHFYLDAKNRVSETETETNPLFKAAQSCAMCVSLFDEF